MLFCDVIGARGHSPGYYQNLFGGRPPRPGGARVSRAKRILYVTQTATNPERYSQRTGPNRNRTSDEASDYSITSASYTNSLRATGPRLRRLPPLGGGNSLFLWIFSGRRDHSPLSVSVRLDVPPIVEGRIHQLVVRIFLKRSKTDQYGKGTEVFLGATEDDICPVEAVTSYVARRGASPGSFFRSESGAPLSKAQFVDKVRAALARAGVQQAGYSGHSFRIGAATTAAQAGLPDSVIQALGRWSSPAFLRYIRTPREELAQYSSPLARRS